MAEKKSEKTEHEYVIPLREKCRPVARYKKTNKAVKTIKEFIARHMRIYDRDLNKIKLDKYVNEYLWAQGIKNPPHKIKVKAIKDSEGLVRVELVDYPAKLKFKKSRAEKSSKEAKEAIEKKKTLKEKVQEQIKGRKENAEDKNDNGIEDKKEEKIKEETSAEASQKMEKEMAKKEKHDSKIEKVDKKKEHSKGDDKR